MNKTTTERLIELAKLLSQKANEIRERTRKDDA